MFTPDRIMLAVAEARGLYGGYGETHIPTITGINKSNNFVEAEYYEYDNREI